MAHLTLALLGAFQATLAGRPVSGLTSNRQQALLAYLAVEAGRAHRRAALASLFWPERSDREALSALRYALSKLRQAIGDAQARPPCLLITRHTIRFNPAGDYRLDLAEFLLAAQPSATLAQLSAAIARYRGEFLAGLSLDDSPAFEEWLLLKREQYHRQTLNFLQQLAAHHEQQGDYDAAGAAVRQHLALDPWHEAAHRQLMRLLARSGQRSAALAQYKICRQVLADELGVAPEDDTTRLYQQIRAGAIAPLRPETLPPLAPSPPAPLFVGRAAELARLAHMLAGALAGSGRVLFVSGEAGRGKTTLLTEFVRRTLAAQPDILFAVGRGTAQAGQGDPYLPFREILGGLTGLLETDWGRGAGRVRQERRLEAALPVMVETLINVGPDLLDRWVSREALRQRAEQLPPETGSAAAQAVARLASAGQLPPAGRQDGLFEQVSRVLETVARQRPLLLILDDLQWADPASLSLLFHLGRRLESSRILLAGAYRPADLALTAQRHPLPAIIHEFQREWGDIVIDLDQAEGGAFVNAYLDSEPNRLDEKFRARLTQTVGGNPLFTVELVHRLQEQGDLTRDAAGYWVTGPELDWQRIPARVEAVIAERLGRLSAQRRAMLDVAGVAGEEFTAELVAGVLRIEAGTVVRTLSESLSKEERLVQTTGLGQTAAGQRLSGYRFRHGLFQHFLYQALDEAERATLHEAVGRQLETLHGQPPADLSPRLAWHFEAAGLLARAADYYLIAGQYAYLLSAYEEAIEHYRRGLALLSQLPPPANPAQQQARHRRELALHLGLALPLGAKLGWANPEQVSTYERAYELARQLPHQHELPAEPQPEFHGQITMATIQSELQQALTFSGHLFALVQQNQNVLGLGLAHWGLGTSRLFRGACVLAREHFEKAVTIYYDYLDDEPDVVAMNMGVNCLTWLAMDLCFLGYPRAALARRDEAIALARRLDNPVSLGVALSVGGCNLHLSWRQPQRVQEIAVELQALAQEKNLLVVLAWLEIALGWCQVETGEFETGLPRMERGIRVWQQMGTIMGHFWHLGLLAEAYGKTGQVDKGLACIEEGEALLRRVGSSQYEPELHRIRGALLSLRAETVNEAEQCFRQAIDIARRQETRWWELRAVTGLARLAQAHGADFRTGAQQMLAELVGWFDADLDLPDLAEARVLLRTASVETSPRYSELA